MKRHPIADVRGHVPRLDGAVKGVDGAGGGLVCISSKSHWFLEPECWKRKREVGGREGREEGGVVSRCVLRNDGEISSLRTRLEAPSSPMSEIKQ